MGLLTILDPTGDTKITWDVANVEATEIAERKFNELKDVGAAMFEVKDGKGENRLREFDPDAEEILAVRQFAGG